MTQRLSQAKLQRALHATQALIAAVHAARSMTRACAALRPRRLAGLSRLLKQMASLPHTASYQNYEPLLKRKLIFARRRVFGLASGPTYSLAAELPSCYREVVAAFDGQARYLLTVLADVTPERGLKTEPNT